ncbi:hypothetical protein HPP92_021403 [Vanilla planifolia]|uniref:Uncharacterized protein n=1 Tax=Vanilla planifolia TaxID=51239 RepID=A0A835Q7X7_VANPL|nr:hypothetical protein HPP92_021403 [Vanilla planifolia]
MLKRQTKYIDLVKARRKSGFNGLEAVGAIVQISPLANKPQVGKESNKHNELIQMESDIVIAKCFTTQPPRFM